MLDFIAVPFGYIMRLIYEIIGNYGLSIVAFTLLTKLLLLPLAIKTKKGMVEIQRLQPKLVALEKKYGKDKEKYNIEVQKLYAEEKINPLGSCLPTLISLPLMLGLYYVISKPLTYFMGLGAAEVSSISSILGVSAQGNANMEIELAGKIWQNFDQVAHVSDKLLHVNFDLFGMNLAATPSFSNFDLLWILPIVSGLTAFLMSWVTKKVQGPQEPSPTSGSMAAMNIMMPLFSVYLGFILPAGLSVYWISNNLLTTIQEFMLSTFMFKAPPAAPEPPKKKKAAELVDGTPVNLGAPQKKKPIELDATNDGVAIIDGKPVQKESSKEDKEE